MIRLKNVRSCMVAAARRRGEIDAEPTLQELTVLCRRLLRGFPPQRRLASLYGLPQKSARLMARPVAPQRDRMRQRSCNCSVALLRAWCGISTFAGQEGEDSSPIKRNVGNGAQPQLPSFRWPEPAFKVDEALCEQS